VRYPLAAIVVAACLGPAAEACTGISMSTTGGQHVHGRTIEWGHFNLNSELVISPRNHSYTSALPMDKKGLTWRSKLGFVGISVSDDRYIGEGINEAGLTAGLFYFKAYGSLAPFDPANTADNIIDMDFVRWMLSQFSTVDEVKAALKSIKIVPVFIDRDGQPSPTAHWRVTDRSGKRIVIEIVDQGQIRIYDNKIGVLANAPDFPWQVENLNNYVHLLPGTVAPRKWGEVELKSFGTGTAAAGLPGDFSPPSRFVRAAFLLHTTPPSKTADEAVSQVFHILNSFDIPLGTEFGKDERAEMPELPSATQWVAVSDQNNGRFFYKTMHHSAIKMVDLKRVNFGTPTELTRALDSGRFTFQILAP
jgi:choloylglycine hydrolase